MTRRSSRVDAPPPQTRPTNSMNPVETASVHLHPAAGDWCGNAYPGGAAAATFAGAAPAEKQANQGGQRAAASLASDLHNWGNDPRPIGGFVNFLQNPSNFPFPQQIPHHAPISTNFQFGSGPTPAQSVPPMPNGIPTPSHTNLSSLRMPSGSHSQQSVDVDAPNIEEVRTTKRLAWIPDEDARLMSSWINNSNDSIRGINKKNEQYWTEVVDVYNSTTPKSQWRSVKQAKDRWHTVNKLVYQFQFSWNKAFKIYSSGQSDDQLMEKAHGFYESEWGGQFLLMKVWKICREHPKWHNYNKELEEAKKKRRIDVEDLGEDVSSALPNDDPPCPIGTKKAKAERYGKSKTKAVTIEMEELEKYQEIQMECSKNRSGILEKQEHLSAEKLETAKVQHLTAKENREAKKHDKECEIWKTYRAMATQDTSGMSESMQEEYAKALKAMRERLLGDSQ